MAQSLPTSSSGNSNFLNRIKNSHADKKVSDKQKYATFGKQLIYTWIAH